MGKNEVIAQYQAILKISNKSLQKTAIKMLLSNAYIYKHLTSMQLAKLKNLLND